MKDKAASAYLKISIVSLALGLGLILFTVTAGSCGGYTDPEPVVTAGLLGL